MLGKGKSGPPSGILTLEFDNIANAPVANPANVADWNTYFDLPLFGTAFTSVTVTGNVVELFNSGTITLIGNAFSPTDADRTYLVRFIDTDIVTQLNNNNHFRRQKNLVECRMPVVNRISLACFRLCSALLEASFPLVTQCDAGFIDTTALTLINLPECTTIANNEFFVNTTSASLTSISIPKLATTTGIGHFRNRTGAFSLNLPLLTAVPTDFCRGCTGMTSASYNIATSIGALAHSSNIALTTCTAPLATSSSDRAFDGCTVFNTYNFNSVLTIGTASFQDTPAMTSANFPACTSIATTAFILSVNNATMTTVNLPLCTTVSGVQNFRRRTGLTTINLASCTTLGATTGNDNVFLGISGNTITCTLPVGTRTDGDAVALAAANTVTFLP
jgi:hypothetical protein